MRWRTGNPSLSAQTFAAKSSALAGGQRGMTISGTVNRALMLFALMLASAIWAWQRYFALGDGGAVYWLLIGAFGGLALGILIGVKKAWSPWLAPIYSVLQGFVVGGASAAAEAEGEAGGIVTLAAMLTFWTLGGLLALYKAGLILPSENFKLGVSSATCGVALAYIANFALLPFGLHIELISGTDWGWHIFSLFVVAVAALNLVLDFDFIEDGCKSNCPRYMEWYAAHGLMVTLIWLYLEILRMAMKKDD